MAREHKTPFPGDWSEKKGESVQEYFKRTDAMFEAIPADRIMSFPVADGRAFYFVFSEKPFVLQHIPHGDAWQIPAAHLKGLRIEDWKRQAEAKKLFQQDSASNAFATGGEEWF